VRIVAGVPASDLVRSQFGPVAEAYVTSSYHASGADLVRLVDTAQLRDIDQVLDLGCGAGHTALAVAPYVTHVTAVDLTPDMVAAAINLAELRGITNVTFKVADSARLPFADASFDVVTSRVAAHHFADVRASLAEAFRVLRPGGRCVIVDTISLEDAALDTFWNCLEVLRDASHVRNWRTSEWLSMLTDAGFNAAHLAESFAISMDGAAWVQRMRTPEQKVAMIRTLLDEATPEQRAAFDIRSTAPWSFQIHFALIAATK
jgi:ubiquinone/menaquinone biosynthesis C-methylase UbiE